MSRSSRDPRRSKPFVFVLTLGALALAAPAVAAATPQAGPEDCLPAQPNTKCKPGGGTQTPGGSGSVSHKGWPKIFGIRWQVVVDSDTGKRRDGTKYSDELLGRNGSDQISGLGAADVLWGDASATVNTAKQHDVISGGAGADWIYASHGTNSISGGSGNDHITGYYGHGTISCGSGRDTVTLKHGKRRYKLHGCEKVKHI